MSLFAVSGGRFSEFGPIRATVDPASVLAEIEAMSQQNRADTPMDRRGRYNSPPWLVALASLLRGAEWGTSDAEVSSRWVLPVRDGDRPAGLTDEQIGNAATYAPEYRNRCRTVDQRALVLRDAILDRGRADGYAAGVRETHHAVHQALAGDNTSGCKWCKGGGR